MTISIFHKNFDFDENFNFWWKFQFLTKITMFDENFDFWRKNRFLTKISIFCQNFDFWRKFWFLTKILIFDENFDFWRKFWFLTKILIFDENFPWISSGFIYSYFVVNTGPVILEHFFGTLFWIFSVYAATGSRPKLLNSWKYIKKIHENSWKKIVSNLLRREGKSLRSTFRKKLKKFEYQSSR